MSTDFARPEWAWLFLALVPLAARAAVGRARRRRDWAALGQAGRPPGDGSLASLAAAGCLVLALTQPRWGSTATPPRPPGHDVVLAVDVSRSMGVEDAVPDRLGLAVEAAGGLVRALGRDRGDRAAVVAFAGRGTLRCPLTENLGAVAEAVRALRPGDVRPGGTDLGAALDAALDAFDDQDRADGRIVVLFSDGEDHADAWKAVVERARALGVVVHTVAVGDAATGHSVPARSKGDRPAGPLTYRGEVVLSRRSDTALAAIATATGGAFVPLGLAAADLGRLYATRIEPEARARRAVAAPPERGERFGVFLLLGLSFLLASCRTGRVRRAAVRPWWLAAAVLASTAGASPAGDESAAARVAEGRAAYASGRFAEALEAFRNAAARAPGEAVPRYDVAAALFQLGRYDEAVSAYDDARGRADDALRTKIDFALGNTAVALGKPADALAHYDACLASTARGDDLDEVRRHAAANRKYAEDRLRNAPGPPKDDRPPVPGADRSKADGGDDGRPDGPGGSSGRDPRDRPSGRRGAGGAGGDGPPPPPSAGGDSPERRLAEALEHVREARRARIDDPPPGEDSGDVKDW